MVKKCYRRRSGCCGYETCIIEFRHFLLFPSAVLSHISYHSRQPQQEATMFPIIRAHRDARILSRQLRKSLASPEDNWKIESDEDAQPSLSNNGIRIVL